MLTPKRSYTTVSFKFQVEEIMKISPPLVVFVSMFCGRVRRQQAVGSFRFVVLCHGGRKVTISGVNASPHDSLTFSPFRPELTSDHRRDWSLVEFFGLDTR